MSEKAEERNQRQGYNFNVIKIEIESILDFHLGVMIKV